MTEVDRHVWHDFRRGKRKPQFLKRRFKFMGKYKILVVDDEKSMREFLSIMLGREGYSVEAFPSGEAALEYFKGNACDLVMADMKMPGMGGLKLLKAVKDINPDVTVIMITAYASVDSAVEAMKSGAYDYFIKPFNVEDIKIHIKRALEWKRLEKRISFSRRISRAGTVSGT